MSSGLPSQGVLTSLIALTRSVWGPVTESDATRLALFWESPESKASERGFRIQKAELEVCFRGLELKNGLYFRPDELLERGLLGLRSRFSDSDLSRRFIHRAEDDSKWGWDHSVMWNTLSFKGGRIEN